MTFLVRALRAFTIYRTAIRDKHTPAAVKWLPIASILYLFWPIDLVPDLVPLLGQLDDIGVIALLCTVAWKLIPPEYKRPPQPMWRPMKNEPKSHNDKPIIDVEPK